MKTHTTQKHLNSLHISEQYNMFCSDPENAGESHRKAPGLSLRNQYALHNDWRSALGDWKAKFPLK